MSTGAWKSRTEREIPTFPQRPILEVSGQDTSENRGHLKSVISGLGPSVLTLRAPARSRDLLSGEAAASGPSVQTPTQLVNLRLQLRNALELHVQFVTRLAHELLDQCAQRGIATDTRRTRRRRFAWHRSGGDFSAPLIRCQPDEPRPARNTVRAARTGRHG